MSKFSKKSPNLDENYFNIPQQSALSPKQVSTHPPRILMLYGSLRERSYSKLLTLEAASLLEAMGAEVKVFDGTERRQEDTTVSCKTTRWWQRRLRSAFESAESGYSD